MSIKSDVEKLSTTDYLTPGYVAELHKDVTKSGNTEYYQFFVLKTRRNTYKFQWDKHNSPKLPDEDLKLEIAKKIREDFKNYGAFTTGFGYSSSSVDKEGMKSVDEVMKGIEIFKSHLIFIKE